MVPGSTAAVTGGCLVFAQALLLALRRGSAPGPGAGPPPGDCPAAECAPCLPDAGFSAWPLIGVGLLAFAAGVGAAAAYYAVKGLLLGATAGAAVGGPVGAAVGASLSGSGRRATGQRVALYEPRGRVHEPGDTTESD